MDRETPSLPGLAAEFELVRELGRGGTAVVYLAIESELERPVAIKVIHPALAVDEESVERLMREARTLARLSHPNIVTLYGTRRLEDGRLALIMQYAGAETLRARLGAIGQVESATATAILRDIGGALAHAHQKRIVHRDIKPENIYLDPDSGRARLSDFGIARFWDHDTGLTLGGVAIGTPTYMSPEQIDGTELDGRSDLYSLGLIGWELLTGRKPWDGESLYGIIYKQKHEQLPPLESLRPDLPKSLTTAVEFALAKRPEDRWPDAEAFLRRLEGTGPAWTPGPPSGRPEEPAESAGAPPLGAPDRETNDGELPTIRFRRPPEEPGAGRPAEVVAPVVPASPRYHASWRLTQGAGEPSTSRRRNRHRSVIGVLGILTLAGSLGAVTEAFRGASPPTTGMDAAETEATETAHDTRGLDPAPELDIASAEVDGEPGATAGLQDSSTIRVPAQLTAVEGARLRGSPLAALTDSIVIRVDDANGRPLPGVAVRFRMLQGGGSIRGRSLETDANGIVRAAWTLGPAEEVNVAVATIDGMPGVRTRLEAESRRPELMPRPALAVGGTHTCALTGTGRLSCWGANNRGQTGTGAGWPLSPTAVNPPAPFVTVAAGASHTCALTSSGRALCWGANERGQLGDGLREARLAPTAVLGDFGYTGMAAGLAHTCALTFHGAIYCWGANDGGQLGDRTRVDRAIPTATFGGHRFQSISAGWAHTCAITHDGAAYCWGDNLHGQLGDGTTTGRAAPIAIAANFQVRTLTTGSAHSCATTAAGDLYCWGRNDDGQLGTGDRLARQAPTIVVLEQPLVQVSAGSVHTCGLTAAGKAYCWGRNLYGQLGDGTTTDRVYPTPVAESIQFTTIRANGAHTCGTSRAGVTYCWGYNADGQLGDGTLANRSRPVAIKQTGR